MSETPPQPPPEPAAAPLQRRPRHRIVAGWMKSVFALLIAIIATLLMMVFTIDLGRFPRVKSEAEKRASSYLKRPMHIGRISMYIALGTFRLDDIVIEGRHAGDKPFFTAESLYFYVPWWTLVSRQLNVELGLKNWSMTLERDAAGTSEPNLKPPPSSGNKPWFTTTVRSVYATNGRFVYDDRLTPWSVNAPNLSFALVRAENLKQYVGLASFVHGGVKIQDYAEMPTDLSTRFVLDGGRVSLTHIDLVSDGSMSHVSGSVDFNHWPEQTYNVNSTLDFVRMREIFFPKETWRSTGTGQFTGVFHLFKEGRVLSGNFASDDMAVNNVGFPDLHGALEWTADHFVVSHADSGLFGGSTRFSYAVAPLGKPGGSAQTFAAAYADADLADLNRFFNLKSLEMAGRATGSIEMNWPSGHFGTAARGRGLTTIRPLGNTEIASATFSVSPRPAAPEPHPFVSDRPLSPLSVAGDVDFSFDRSTGMWTFAPSWAATPYSYVQFQGQMAADGASNFPFHVTSHDWQESDRVLSRIMTALSGPTGAIEVSGRGMFDGLMTGSFSAPRITGRVSSEATRVWDVTWGHAEADVAIEGGYVDITKARVGDRAEVSIVPEGRYALGYRKDNREEINGKVTVNNWPMADLRHAFVLDDWPVDGTLGKANLVMRGKYREMYGTGDMRIDQGKAWGERFETATGDLELEGTGLRVHRIAMKKGPGLLRGDARVGWNGTYSFTADGEGIPVEQLDSFKVDQAPLSGRLRFTASGASEFDHPSYTFRGTIDDLFAGDQGIGLVQGTIRIDGKTMFIERLVANSGLLAVESYGQIAFDEKYNSTLHLRLTKSSLDPYLKFMAPKLSPYTRAIISGTVDVRGPLGAPHDLTIGANLEDASLTLFDYELTNDGPVQMTFDEDAFRIGRLRLKGSDTSLELTGGASVGDRRWNLSAVGEASLAILQARYAVTASGAATLNANLQGSFDAPSLTGDARLTNGRLRPLSSIHSLEAIDGRITFDGSRISLAGLPAPGQSGPAQPLRGRIGGGDVTFGGTIAISGYSLTEYNLTATGRSMSLRYPAGFKSTANMDLALVGPLEAPRLTGNLDVLRVEYVGSTNDSGLFGFAAVGTTGAGVTPGPVTTTVVEGGTPLLLDIQVTAPRMPLVNTRNKNASIEGAATLHVSGTFDRPSIIGSVDILRGEFVFQGNRYFVREGSIDFRGGDQVEPLFDVAAETRPRLGDQTYDVNIQMSGPPSRLTMQFSSDPPLSETDIISMLFGGVPNANTAEQRSLRSEQEAKERMLQTAGAALLASPITNRVGEVFENTFSSVLDTVQIVPYLANETAFQQLNPGARVTLGKSISPKLYLTYSRTLGAGAAQQDELILLEYEQNERVSWILSRNENRTFALDFRIRYVH